MRSLDLSAASLGEPAAGVNDEVSQGDEKGCVLAIAEVRSEIVFGMEKPDHLREFIVPAGFGYG